MNDRAAGDVGEVVVPLPRHGVDLPVAALDLASR
jgi:hypothetical protein